MGCIAGLQPANHLHQGHHGHGVEEMHANELRWVLGDLSQLCDGYGRGVGGQNGLGFQVGFEEVQYFDFETEVLGGCLYDQIAVVQGVVLRAGLDQRQGTGLVIGRDFFFAQQSLKTVGDGFFAFVQGLLSNVHHRHVNA